MRTSLLRFCFLAFCVLSLPCTAQSGQAAGKTRMYSVSADEVESDYAPHRHRNIVTVTAPHGHPFPGPAQFVVADMMADNIGTWMFHCHLSDHKSGGMMTTYEVLP